MKADHLCVFIYTRVTLTSNPWPWYSTLT